MLTEVDPLSPSYYYTDVSKTTHKIKQSFNIRIWSVWAVFMVFAARIQCHFLITASIPGFPSKEIQGNPNGNLEWISNWEILTHCFPVGNPVGS